MKGEQDMAEDEEFRTVAQGGSARITEKKSRFIATVVPVSTETEALAELDEIRKRYRDARHNCYAWVTGGKTALSKCSDDGEPSGTAGRPILEVIQGENLKGTLIVVTRYFGGILLGTGGLIRAYTKAARDGLEASRIVTRKPGVRLKITTDYNGLGKIQYILGQQDIPIEESVYTDTVQLTVTLPAKEAPQIEEALSEATAGKTKFSGQEDCWYDV